MVRRTWNLGITQKEAQERGPHGAENAGFYQSLRVGVEAGRPGPEDGTWRPRRARPGSLPTPVMRPGQGGQAMGRWELQRQEQLLLRC